MSSLRNVMLLLAVISLIGCATVQPSDPYVRTSMVFKHYPHVAPFFGNAYGYAVFPTVGKGGFVVGAAYGKGRVYRQGTATGMSTLVKMSIGWQLGGQAFSEIIFFQDQRAYDEFTSGNFEFDASASAVVITAGAQAQAGTAGASAGASVTQATGAQAPVSYRKGTAVFVLTKGGLMYEAVIGGQAFTFKPL